MALNGIETVVYGVNDVRQCTRYFDDFGLPLYEDHDRWTHFRLDEGSNVIVRHIDDPALPRHGMAGIGVVETIWGVDNETNLEKLVKSLSVDHEIRRDADGTAHFVSPEGQAMGLRVFRKNPVFSASDPVNTPGNVQRVNRHRKWLAKARPKTIQHAVWAYPDYHKAFAYFRDRLGFRLTDDQRGFGLFGRCDGAMDHHNIYCLNASLPFPGLDGRFRFNHVNFGVTDLDEVMVGANHMERCGWPKSVWGLGRHRIASSIFMYLPCPAGGDAEYGADSDMVDDGWQPRTWEPLFGSATFMHNIQPWISDAPQWDVAILEGAVPAGKSTR